MRSFPVAHWLRKQGFGPLDQMPEATGVHNAFVEIQSCQRVALSFFGSSDRLWRSLEIGGSGRSAEVADLVIERMKIPESEQAVILKSGQSRVYNQIHWARMYLVKAGLLSPGQRGIWTLTERGRQADLTDDFARKAFLQAQREQRPKRKKHDAASESVSVDEVDLRRQGVTVSASQHAAMSTIR